MGLARWGLGLLDEPRPGDAFRPEAARWARETYEFHVPVDDGVSEPEYKPAFEPDIVVRIDLHTFLSLISGWSRRTP
jgi:hypothetical protein